MAEKKSNTSTAHAEILAASKAASKSGATWAQRFIDCARIAPNDYELQGWIDDAEGLFKDNPLELHEFYTTLQAAIGNASEVAGVTRDVLDVVRARLGRAAVLLLSLHSTLRVREDLEDRDELTLAAIEKAGALLDGCLDMLLVGQVCGDADTWSALGAVSGFSAAR